MNPISNQLGYALKGVQAFKEYSIDRYDIDPFVFGRRRREGKRRNRFTP
jgi:hypothetical protein